MWVSDADEVYKIDELVNGGGATIGWRIENSEEIEIYSAIGVLQQIVSRSGYTRVLHYDVVGRLDRVVDTFGRTLIFDYDESNLVIRLTDPAGSVYSYAYDGEGDLVRITYPIETAGDSGDASVRTYSYGDSGASRHLLTGIVDENNDHFATWSYDDEGRVVLSEHTGGAGRVQLTYNTDGTTTVKDAIGTSRTHHFETVLGVVKGSGISQPSAVSTDIANSSVTHDANGNVATRDDFNGHRTRYWHDLARNLEITRVEGLALESGGEVVKPETRTLTTQWHATWRLPTVEKTYTGGADSAGQPLGTLVKTVVSSYDANGNLLTRTETDNQRNESRTWTYTWNTYGRLASVLAPSFSVYAQNMTTYTYYQDDDPDLARRGQLWKVTNAVGHVTEIQSYDLHGHPLKVRDPNGLITEYTYTARGWLKNRLVGERLTTYTYDKVGQLTRVDLPNGARLEYTYDNAHRLTDIRNGWGDHIHFTLDGLGNIREETVSDAQGNQASKLSREYDALGRLWKEVRRINGQDAVTEYGYDASGNRTTQLDPLSHPTHWAHDALDRLASTEDALQGQTVLARDAQDRVTQYRDPKGFNTNYEIDAFGQVRKETSPGRGVTTYSYLSNGNLSSIVDARGKTVVFSQYDALDRLQAMGGQSGLAQAIGNYWDILPNSLGRLAIQIYGSDYSNWLYDSFGEVIQKSQHHSNGNLTQTVGYTYLNGDLTRITYPSGAYVDYTWSQGRVTEVRVNGSPLLTGIQYQPFGTPKAWTWGNGLSYRIDQDPETGWTSKYPLAADSRTLVYDAAGRISAYSHLSTGQNKSFDYDALDRVTGMVTNQGAIGWLYDGNGNRTRQQSGGVDYLYAYAINSNRLQTVAGPVAKNYQYDAAGNVVNDGTYAYTYDDYHRLSKITWNGQATNYYYNGMGQRVLKTGRGATNGVEYYVYDEGGLRLGDYTSGGARLQETVWLGDRPVGVLTSTGALLYVYADHLNAPRVLTDATNKVVWRWDGDVFGVGGPAQDPDGDGVKVVYSLRFPGQAYDGETGLHYNYHRHYEPRTGRYVEADPIGLAGGSNLYTYVRNNPLRWIDPLGLFTYSATAGGPVNFDTEAALICFEICTAQDIIVTAGQEGGHSRGSAHETGQACDVGKNSNPNLKRNKAQACFEQCFPQQSSYGQEEGNHYHFQTRPGRGGASGFAPGVR